MTLKNRIFMKLFTLICFLSIHVCMYSQSNDSISIKGGVNFSFDKSPTKDVFVEVNGIITESNDLGKFLIKTIIECPDFQGFRSWSLATKDAHGLYAKFGFKEMENPKIWMRKVNFSAY